MNALDVWWSVPISFGLNCQIHGAGRVRRPFEMVRERKIYKNTEMQEGMPVYASGIFREEKLVLFVVIYEVNPDQYGMNYMNIFRILCGLVQTSFLRALDYEELAEEKIYYPQTNVVRRERFMEILAVQSEMKEKKIADYVLVKLEEKERHKVSDSLSRIIRGGGCDRRRNGWKPVCSSHSG